MEKVHRNIICLIILLLIFSCKSDKKTTTDSETKELQSIVVDTIKTDKYSKFKYENPNCLKESDSLEVKKFRQELIEAITKKDTLAILEFVQLDYMDKNITIKEKKKALQIYLEPIMELCFKEVMPEYALHILDGAEYFDNIKNSKEGCFSYQINNSFPEMEVTHIFIFEKINGEIKLVAIETIG